MNAAQKWVVISSLCVLSAALIFVFWAFGTQYDFHQSLLVWRIRETNGVYGLRLRMGATGIICGLILPIALLGVAAFFATSDKR
jgi:hypothetical protein